MKLSRTVSYAVQATLKLAQSNTREPIPCRRLAEEGQMPERFLLQILRSLVNHGILRSTRGVDGGYTMLRPPEEVSLLEVIEAVEGPLDSKFARADGLPEASHDRLKSALEEITTSARQQLEAVKIAHLLPPPDVAVS